MIQFFTIAPDLITHPLPMMEFSTVPSIRHPLETTEEVIAISELQEIIHFINKNQQERSRGKGEKRMSVTINKNGRTFIVE